jgi:transposase
VRSAHGRKQVVDGAGASGGGHGARTPLARGRKTRWVTDQSINGLSAAPADASRRRQGGEQALREGRHGHPVKLRGEVRHWLEQTCRQAPSTPSHEIQMQLAHQFSLQVSVSQINRTRIALGVSNPPQSAKKSD